MWTDLVVFTRERERERQRETERKTERAERETSETDGIIEEDADGEGVVRGVVEHGRVQPERSAHVVAAERLGGDGVRWK